MPRPQHPGEMASQNAWNKYWQQLQGYAGKLKKELGADGDSIKEPGKPNWSASCDAHNKYEQAYESYVIKLEKALQENVKKLEDALDRARKNRP